MSAKSSTAAVDAYIDAAADFAKPILHKLRGLIKKAAPHWAEAIKWNSPSYSGRALVCGFAAFNRHVSFHFYRGAQLSDPDKVLSHGEGNVSGKSVKFSAVDEIDEKKLLQLLAEAAAVDAEEPGERKPRAKREPLPVPPELVTALRKDLKAMSFFDSLAPSCQREYIEWISSAKRPETLARRLQGTMAMLRKGERRNDQYRN